MRDMFEELSRLLNYTEAKHELINSGLKNAIKRPHNLYTIKDDELKLSQHLLRKTTLKCVYLKTIF